MEQLLWTARPDSPKYASDPTIFFLQLNNIYNELKLKYDATTLGLLPLPQGGTLPLIQWSHLEQTMRTGFLAVGPCYPE